MIAAPFWGEFGWECSLWAPWLRWMMQHYYSPFEGTKLMVLCRAGHEHLYEDFAAAVPCRVPDDIKVDCEQVWVNGVRLDKDYYRKFVRSELGRTITKKELLTPLHLQTTWRGNQPPHLGKRGQYHCYGGEPTLEGWIGIHARMCRTKQPERNWDIAKWTSLLEELKAQHVVAVGTEDAALCPPGAEDLRGLPLRDVCLALSRCQVAVGPSSGPLALAMLCGTDVIWWSPNVKDVLRFDNLWNPFEVRTLQLVDGWDPHPDDVEAACLKFL